MELKNEAIAHSLIFARVCSYICSIQYRIV